MTDKSDHINLEDVCYACGWEVLRNVGFNGDPCIRTDGLNLIPVRALLDAPHTLEMILLALPGDLTLEKTEDGWECDYRPEEGAYFLGTGEGPLLAAADLAAAYGRWKRERDNTPRGPEIYVTDHNVRDLLKLARGVREAPGFRWQEGQGLLGVNGYRLTAEEARDLNEDYDRACSVICMSYGLIYVEPSLKVMRNPRRMYAVRGADDGSLSKRPLAVFATVGEAEHACVVWESLLHDLHRAKKSNDFDRAGIICEILEGQFPDPSGLTSSDRTTYLEVVDVTVEQEESE